MPNNDNNSTMPEEFKVFLEWKAIVVDAFAGLNSNAVAFVKPATGSLGVVFLVPNVHVGNAYSNSRGFVVSKL